MRKYEYKLEAYNFEVSIYLAANIERTLNKKGTEGWELVQWDLIQERLNESSLFQNTMSTTGIVATWKREVNN